MPIMHPRDTQPKSFDGGSGSFEAFYTATAARTFDTVRRMAAGDGHLANDATQEAYVVMLQCWPVRQSRSLNDNRKYVLGIAANKVTDWFRLQHRHLDLDGEVETLPVDEPGFDAVVDEVSLCSAVRKLIARQPVRRRAVAILFFLHEFEYREIADALDIAESTVRTHVERLRILLKPLIDQGNETNRGGEWQ